MLAPLPVRPPATREDSEIHAAWKRGDMTEASTRLINALGPEGVAPFIYFRF